MNSELVSYQCDICKDGGWVHPLVNGKIDYTRTIRCRCKTESDARDNQQKLLKFCALPKEVKNFENFKTYGDPKLEEARQAAMELAEASVNSKINFLTLIGESDRGKSHLAQAVCRSWLERNMPARYAKAPDLLVELRAGFDALGEDSYKAKRDFYCRVGLLALDDLGTEKITQWGAEQIQTIIDSRYDNRLPLIITTNRPIDDLFNAKDYRDEWREIANMRVCSRLKRESWCRVIFLSAVKEHRMRKG